VPWGSQRMLRFLFHGEARGCFAFCSMGKPADASLLFHGGERGKRSPEGGYKAQTLTNLAYQRKVCYFNV
ncbi:MAG: hypothetical protein ACOC2Z_16385, partial [Coleofasciculus sp.]